MSPSCFAQSFKGFVARLVPNSFYDSSSYVLKLELIKRAISLKIPIFYVVQVAAYI